MSLPSTADASLALLQRTNAWPSTTSIRRVVGRPWTQAAAALLLVASQSVVAQAPAALTPRATPAANLEFATGIKGWRTVLDGVMGGLSTGKIAQSEPGILKFTGELSLDNNGGFSQTQTSVPVGTFADQKGVVVRLRGDGRRYQFDVRCSNVRMMAGSFQLQFDTKPDTWLVLELPFQDFKLYSFGQLVRNPAKLRPENVESVGITLADKKAGSFAIEIDYIRPLGAATSAKSADLATVAEQAGLTTLLTLAKASGLELAPGQRYTLFAPTNAAFAQLPAEKVKFLTSPEGKTTLQQVLKHHVLAMTLDSASLLARRRVQALSGQSIAVDADALTVGAAKILAADVAFDGGLVHVVDAVILPELRSITELLSTQVNLSTLRTAVEAAGLGAQLSAENPGPWTVLAPSNEAFAALPPGALQKLLENRDQLQAVLAAHVIPSAIRRQEMLAQGSARTLMGQSSVNFALTKGAVTASGAQILTADIEAANGVVHIIDRVLLPEPVSQSAKAAETVPVPADAAILAVFDLAIERGVPLFNSGERAACAAIYEVAIGSVTTVGEMALPASALATLKTALRDGRQQQDPTERAWTFRLAMDKVRQALGLEQQR